MESNLLNLIIELKDYGVDYEKMKEFMSGLPTNTVKNLNLLSKKIKNISAKRKFNFTDTGSNTKPAKRATLVSISKIIEELPENIAIGALEILNNKDQHLYLRYLSENQLSKLLRLVPKGMNELSVIIKDEDIKSLLKFVKTIAFRLCVLNPLQKVGNIYIGYKAVVKLFFDSEFYYGLAFCLKYIPPFDNTDYVKEIDFDPVKYKTVMDSKIRIMNNNRKHQFGNNYFYHRQVDSDSLIFDLYQALANYNDKKIFESLDFIPPKIDKYVYERIGLDEFKLVLLIATSYEIWSKGMENKHPRAHLVSKLIYTPDSRIHLYGLKNQFLEFEASEKNLDTTYIYIEKCDGLVLVSDYITKVRLDNCSKCSFDLGEFKTLNMEGCETTSVSMSLQNTDKTITVRKSEDCIFSAHTSPLNPIDNQDLDVSNSDNLYFDIFTIPAVIYEYNCKNVNIFKKKLKKNDQRKITRYSKFNISFYSNESKMLSVKTEVHNFKNGKDVILSAIPTNPL